MPNNDLISRKALLKRFEELKDNPNNRLIDIAFLDGAMSVIDAAPTVDTKPVRQGRCRMCNIKETGHGVIACYDVGWEVCINRSGLNYYMAVNHGGSQINFQIDFCPYCGAKMEGKK